MKKFKFKLEGLLKLRNFEEQKIKIEIGKINKKISRNEEDIVQLENTINQSYIKLSDNNKKNMIAYLSSYINAKKKELQDRKNNILMLKKKYWEKVEELKTAMAKGKIIQNLRDKKILEFKKKLNKKNQEELEEFLK